MIRAAATARSRVVGNPEVGTWQLKVIVDVIAGEVMPRGRIRMHGDHVDESSQLFNAHIIDCQYLAATELWQRGVP